MIPIRIVRLDDPLAVPLVEGLVAEMNEIYGEGVNVPYDAGRFDPPDGRFLVWVEDRRPIACGGFIRFDRKSAELKRMYVVPERRGRGLSRQLLAAIEREATAAGYRSMVLETGTLQPQAVGLYRSAGYLPIPCYPPYAARDLSRCFARSLAGAAPPA